MQKETAVKILNDILKHLGMSVKQFSDSLGKERPQWAYDVLNPEKKVGISKNIADLISEHYPQFNKAWLLTGEGEMLNKDGAAVVSPSPDTLSDYETWLLPQTAQGGSLANMPADGVELRNCEKIVSPIKGADFAITIYGDSMYPEYPSGSRVLIKRINPEAFIDWGKAYVLDTCNGVVLKEVVKCPREGFITCHSVNPDPKYADFDVPLSEIYGIYRVMMCMAAK